MGLFGGGGFFGSGGKTSQSTSRITTTTDTQTAAFSELSNSQATAVKGSGNVTNILDQGAIAGAFDFAKDALKFSESVNATGAGLVASAVTAVGESRKSESENVSGKAVTYLSYTAMAFAVAWAIRGWKK